MELSVVSLDCNNFFRQGEQGATGEFGKSGTPGLAVMNKTLYSTYV